jgi:hypothetical protein
MVIKLRFLWKTAACFATGYSCLIYKRLMLCAAVKLYLRHENPDGVPG